MYTLRHTCMSTDVCTLTRRHIAGPVDNTPDSFPYWLGYFLLTYPTRTGGIQLGLEIDVWGGLKTLCVPTNRKAHCMLSCIVH